MKRRQNLREKKSEVKNLVTVSLSLERERKFKLNDYFFIKVSMQREISKYFLNLLLNNWIFACYSLLNYST